MSFDFSEVLGRYERVAIVGGPKAGKTTLARQAQDRPVLHTDETMDREWPEQPAIWMARTAGAPRFVIEGVQVARCLRKGMEVDAVIFLTGSMQPLTKAQLALSKGVGKVFMDWFRSKEAALPVFFL